MRDTRDRLLLRCIGGLSFISLACYTAVWRLCRQEATNPDAGLAARRRRLANIAHMLDWSVNLIIALASRRMLQQEVYGGQHHPRWLRIYYVITGPLPTLGMVATMITGYRWGPTMAHTPWQRRLHRLAATGGYVAWWFSILPIFVQPWVNRWAQQQQTGVAQQES